jgi:hypothetical protein
LSNKSNIIAAPAGRQSSNGLVERTWRTIIEMGRAYMSEKQMPRDYWFFAIRQAVLMLNQTPGRLGRKITTPYELVHGVKPDSRTWFELFSIGFFAHDTDLATNEARTTSQAQTIAGIAVGRDASTNTITFYNPITRTYYRPPSFKLGESLLPITMFPKHIHYDGGLTCGRLRHNTDPTQNHFLPVRALQSPAMACPQKELSKMFLSSILPSSHPLPSPPLHLHPTLSFSMMALPPKPHMKISFLPCQNTHLLQLRTRLPPPLTVFLHFFSKTPNLPSIIMAPFIVVTFIILLKGGLPSFIAKRPGPSASSGPFLFQIYVKIGPLFLAMTPSFQVMVRLAPSSNPILPIMLHPLILSPQRIFFHRVHQVLSKRCIPTILIAKSGSNLTKKRRKVY